MQKVILIAALIAAGCSKKESDSALHSSGTGPECDPLVVIVDGTVLPSIPYGLARTTNKAGDITYEVLMMNHDITPCEQYINKGGRNVPRREISVRAWSGGTGPMGRGVGIETHTQANAAVRILGDKPSAINDTLKLCADSVTFTPQFGEYKGKEVSLSGLFEGKYCGELVFD